MTPTPTRPEPTTPTPDEILSLVTEARDLLRKISAQRRKFGPISTAAQTQAGKLSFVIKGLKQHLTSEPAASVPVTIDPERLATVFGSLRHKFSEYSDLDIANAIIGHFALLAASTGARGAVVEEIAKRHEKTQKWHDEPNAHEFEPTTAWCVYTAWASHQDRGVLLALIGAKTP